MRFLKMLSTTYRLMINTINFTDDHCRVVLSGGEHEDYINASHMDVRYRFCLSSFRRPQSLKKALGAYYD